MERIGVLLLLVAAATASPLEGRITHGNTATLGQFPYQVGLSMQISATSSSWCGGSLIGTQWVLTAAHCTHNIQSVIVYLGATDRTSAELTYFVQNNDIIVHANYDPNILRNDISLIRIPATLYTPRIQPIRLPSIYKDTALTYVGEPVIASGWGRLLDSINNVAEHLQWARLVIVPNEQCNMAYGSSLVFPTNICVGTSGGTSTCNGDSGGPLVLENTGVQIGLVSFGATAGCEKGFPIAFTRLTSYLKWIEINTNISY